MKSHDKSTLRKKELIAKLTSTSFQLARKFDVDFVILGGSWARGQQRWWSDIDIFVSWPEYSKKSANDRLNSLIELNILAEEMTGLNRLELRILEKQSLHVQFQVLKEGIIIYTKNPDYRNKYLEHLMPFYFDHLIWFNNFLDQSLNVG